MLENHSQSATRVCHEERHEPHRSSNKATCSVTWWPEKRAREDHLLRILREWWMKFWERFSALW